jgi:CheY-like chemotaxis protein
VIWPSCGEPDDRTRDLAMVGDALDLGRPTAGDPQRRALQSLALALRDAPPRPRPAFLAELDARMRDALDASLAVMAGAGAPAAPRPIRVLVAAGAEVDFLAMERLLARHGGFEVVDTVDGARTALAVAAATRPDVVIVEGRPRGLDTGELVQRLLALPPPVRVLRIEADARSDSFDDIAGSGAVSFLHKRRAYADLPAAVIAAAEGRRARRMSRR